MRKYLLVLLATAIAAGPVRAQSDADDATASVRVVATVDVSATEHIDFGDQAAAAGTVLSSAVPTRAAWSVIMDAIHNVQIDFVLPPKLLDLAGNEVSAFFGTTSAHFTDGLTDVLFDPASGTVLGDVASSFDVYLGEDIQRDGTGDVAIDVSNGIAGSTYNGVITMTVTIL